MSSDCRHRVQEILTLVVLTVAIMTFPGCSIILAATGKPDPDLSVVQVGATREAVEAELGSPYLERMSPIGQAHVTYRFPIGVDGDTDRAMDHAGADMATYGLWEIVGTPVELAHDALSQGEITVIYDWDDRVLRTVE
jgi:hypothetical protein